MFQTNTTVLNTTSGRVGNITQYTSKTIVSQWFSKEQRKVNLVLLGERYPLSVFSTCFRPDIGGHYEASLSVSMTNAPLCSKSSLATIDVSCPNSQADLSKINSFSVNIDRDQPTRVLLDASSVNGGSRNLTYTWSVVYPSPLSVSKIDGHPLIVPQIITPVSLFASFVVPEANIDYVVQLSVTDHCYTSVKTITISTPCKTVIPLNNLTLAATYTGEIPVTMLSFSYDHTVEVQSFIKYPSCQHYSWSVVDYSATISSSLVTTGTTEFTKTSGFAALISIVVILAVIIPIVIWLYCTKKACFKSTDPRV